jgi:hypothetical protein
LTDSGIWDSLKQIVSGTFGVIKGTFELSVRIIKSIWNDALSVIRTDTFGIFGVISGVVRSALQIISGTVNAFSNLLQGNWKGLGDSLVTILKGSFNFMVTMTEGFVLAITGAFGKIFEMIGVDAITKTFKTASESLKATFEGFKYSTKDEKEAPKKTETKGGVVDLGDGVKQVAELSEKEKKAREKAKSDYLKNTEKLLSESLALENSLISEKYKREMAQEVQLYQEKVTSINKEVADIGAKHRLLQALQTTHQKKMAEIVTANNFGSATVSEGGIQNIGTRNLTSGFSIGNPLEGLTEKLDSSIPKVLQKFDTFSGQLTGKVLQIKNIFSGVSEGIKSSLQDATSGAITGLANVFGSMIAGTAGIQDAGRAILGVVAGVFSQMGEMFTKAGVAMLLLDALKTNPFTSAGALIGAGVLLSALGSAVSSTVSSGGASGGGSSSGYSGNYSSGSSGYNSGANQNQSGRAMTLNVKLTGDLKASGNDMRMVLEKNIRQTVRTIGG